MVVSATLSRDRSELVDYLPGMCYRRVRYDSGGQYGTVLWVSRGGGEGGAHRINKGHEPYSLQAHFLSTVPRAHPVLSKVTDMDAHPCVLR